MITKRQSLYFVLLNHFLLVLRAGRRPKEWLLQAIVKSKVNIIRARVRVDNSQHCGILQLHTLIKRSTKIKNNNQFYVIFQLFFNFEQCWKGSSSTFRFANSQQGNYNIENTVHNVSCNFHYQAFYINSNKSPHKTPKI